MQRGGRSSPCCLQAVTVWIRALRPPLTIPDAPPQAAGRPPDPRSASPTQTRVPTLTFSARSPHFCRKGFYFQPASNFARREVCAQLRYRREVWRACAARPCVHWRARVQGVNRVQGVEGGGAGGDTKVTFLLIVWTK